MKGEFETNRGAISKGVGLTPSERYLAKLAEHSFLNLWSYPNPYRDQGRPRSGDGKELCDLLIVCGGDIVIFSEKNIAWPKRDMQTAWRRWAKKALLDSARQVKGAERWITQFPDRIFLDPRCTHRFPIDLPEKHEAAIHLVVVARGAGEACKLQFGDGRGSLRIRPEVRGEQHCVPDGQLFTVGDLDPAGSFVHVMDDVTLDIVLRELDTVLDFTDYLAKKAEFARSGLLRSAAGEQDLLAHYAIRVNEDGEHDFIEDRTSINVPLDLAPGGYERFESDPRYLARRQANEISYFWDRLIESFTKHMIAGTSVLLDGYEYDLRRNELGVRQMALQRRTVRRGLGEAVAEAMMQRGASTDQFFRAIAVPEGQPDCGTGFFVFTLKYLDWKVPQGGYDKYRRIRANVALAYAKGLLVRLPYLERVVGISCEPTGQAHGGSEDLVYVEQAQWSDADRVAIEEDCKRLGILQPGITAKRFYEEEFPVV